jgi:two-component system response regulator
MANCEKTILLVEDNPDDVELVKRAFDKSKLVNKMETVADGEAAVNYLYNVCDELPEVVLLDLKLPRLDGLEVLKRIRANPKTKLLPVVILTSSREERDLLSGYELGANSYIQKPLDFDQFIRAVEQLGLYWLVLNISPSSLGN